MTTTYQPPSSPYIITPTFTKDGVEYKFEGMYDNETRLSFRFIVLTLRKYLGVNGEFAMRGPHVIISTLSSAQMKILRAIDEDTCDFPVKYGRSKLKFDITMKSIPL
jgi:hypothetical protein